LELISADFEGIEPTLLKKEKYSSLFNKKCEFIDELIEIYNQNNVPYRVDFGKGHSIRAGGDFIMLDFVKLDKQKSINSAYNHDSIITADSILTHTSLTSVFVSINNALNDLFSNGVFENITIYPTYDGTVEEISELRKNLQSFLEFYRTRGVDIKLIDLGPLNLNLKIIGASVTGTTDKLNRRFSGLTSGNEILLTKHLGDLSFLSLYRSYYFNNNEKQSLSKQRVAVLQEMTTSNYLVGKLLNSYMPKIDDTYDPKKHISFSSDISGPGVDVLFEAAEISHVDLDLVDPIFLFPVSLYFSRKNHTSSTNGPIAISAGPNVISHIETNLRALGFEKMWKIGKVI
jgi:selenophosphate synthase